MAKSAKELLKGVEVVALRGTTDGLVSAVVHDSRRCEDKCLFVAIRGETDDGHNHIGEALAAGARFIVHEKDFIPPPNVSAFQVTDSRKALALIARNFYDDPSARMMLIGVSGTNGKTTITYILESILKAYGGRVGVIGTIDYRYDGKSFSAANTTPDALALQSLLNDMLLAGVRQAVMEVSSHAIAMRRVDGCRFDFGVFTNLSQDHLDFHHDMENYYQTKRRFFMEMIDKKKSPYVSINLDDSYGVRLAGEIGNGLVGYGIDSAVAIGARNIDCSLSGIRADVIHHGGAFPISSPLIGKHNLMNILAATSAALSMGVSIPAIQEGIANLACVPGRLERVGRFLPATFVDYAHTPDALERVITHLLLFKRRRLITVFGCGGNRDRGKRPLMGNIAARLGDIAIITSDNPRDEAPKAIIAEIANGVNGAARKAQFLSDLADNGGYLAITDRREAIAAAVKIAAEDDIILIAGKGHEKYQEVKGKRSFFDDGSVVREEMVRRRSVGAAKPLGIKASVADIVKASRGKLITGSAETIIEGISTDTRGIVNGSAFVALAGERYNGHDFLQEAADRGASCLIASAFPADLRAEMAMALVDDTLIALGGIANWWRGRFDIPIVGITGSSGKTTTKEMLAAICSSKKMVTKSVGNFNNLVGLPLSLLSLRDGDEIGIFEMGANSPGEIAQLTAIAEPTIALIINIGTAHIGGFGSVEKMGEEKTALFRGIKNDGVIVVNNDDEILRKFARGENKRKITFWMNNAANVTAKNIAQKDGVLSFDLEINGAVAFCRLPVIGRHNIGNALAAAAVASIIGFGVREIADALSSYHQPPRRMNIVNLGKMRIIDDTYNANPDSMKRALETLKEAAAGQRMFVVLGDMLEIGNETNRLHREVGYYAASLGVERLFLRGSNASEYAAGAAAAGLNGGQIEMFTEAALAAKTISESISEGGWVLVKGSRSAKMEEVVEAMKTLIKGETP